MSNISVTELHDIITKDPQAVVIDVRTPMEYDEVHVTEAKLHPLDKLDPNTIPADKEAPVYLLCRSGSRAILASNKFLAAGFQQPVVVEGGTLAWIEAGFPVKRSEVKVISLERQVRIAAGALVLLGVLLSLTVHPNFVYLSGFIGAGLVFAGITDWCGMGLLIAKAPWNRR